MKLLHNFLVALSLLGVLLAASALPFVTIFKWGRGTAWGLLLGFCWYFCIVVFIHSRAKNNRTVNQFLEKLFKSGQVFGPTKLFPVPTWTVTPFTRTCPVGSE